LWADALGCGPGELDSTSRSGTNTELRAVKVGWSAWKAERGSNTMGIVLPRLRHYCVDICSESVYSNNRKCGNHIIGKQKEIKMLPEYRPFCEYHTDDETVLTEQLFEEYEDVVSQAQAVFLWSEAYDRRHSGGLEEVYCEFISLVRLFYKMRSI